MMCVIGYVEMVLEWFCQRVLCCEVFGKKLVEFGVNFDIIVEVCIEIEMICFFCFKVVWMIDCGNFKEVVVWISQIKVVVLCMVLKIIDEFMQMYGGMGISQDMLFVCFWMNVCMLCFVDGLDVVYCCQIVCEEFKCYMQEKV